jgi:hypothetical protein
MQLSSGLQSTLKDSKKMLANRINRNLGANKAMPVYIILLCGLILAPGRPLRAQQSVDLPSKPEPTTATIQQDSSTSDSSTSGASIDAPVIPAQPLTFGERLKIYERSFIQPESVIGPAPAGMGTRRWRLRNAVCIRIWSERDKSHHCTGSCHR